MQAITTKYLVRTETRGPRVVARSASGVRASVGYHDYGDVQLASVAAARKLARRLQWWGQWLQASTHTGYVFVCLEGCATVTNSLGFAGFEVRPKGVNIEGLTWSEWFAAATHGAHRKPTADERRAMAKEWSDGVDPTEWGALLSR